jgi:hypothetical protein
MLASRFLLAIGLTCLSGIADAQQPGRIFPYQWPSDFPSNDITTADVQHALIWTGRYAGMADGAYGPSTKKGIANWLTSKGYPGSETLTVPQASQLVSEGLKQRDRYGWALLVDDAIDFSIGVPTAVSSHNSQNGMATSYNTLGLAELAKPFQCSQRRMPAQS